MDKGLQIGKEKLRYVYNDIINAYSSVKSKTFGRICIKHFTNRDTAWVDESAKQAEEKARSRGLPTVEEKLEMIDKDESWTKEQESGLKADRAYIQTLRKTKQKLFIESEQVQVQRQIEELKKKVKGLEDERELAVGYTTETYATKKANEKYVYLGLFKDNKIEERLITEEEYDSLSQHLMAELVTIYNDDHRKFELDVMKRVALSSFFLNVFYLCEDDPFVFFGEPVIKLTFHQLSLFAQGKTFKSHLSNSKHPPPDELFDDPDELMNWFEQSKSADEALEKLDASSKGSAERGRDSVAGASSLVGATEKDLRKLGLGEDQGPSISLAQEAKTKNGTLDMQEMMRLHGIGK